MTSFVEATRQIRVGNGANDGVQMGPMITPKRRDAIAELVRDACDRGARLLLGGKPIEGPGYFFQPTLLDDVLDNPRQTA